MSEHLTHIAVYEDCARLILNSGKFCEAFRTCVSDQYDSGLTTRYVNNRIQTSFRAGGIWGESTWN